ncbi:AfsR/SARP family transcriptional regulator [Mycolicibacter algericus]|uniref:OmpR/PhoB-type domain-containing protein n=2 Tax=Mycolicibacter algericus TaxID=1288388 RepID=A0A7I9Y795_MYCAL|nr:hypothetical protein BST10_02540 [Mycolicibacter algericus DSM 45454]GFG84551.1 hypothetical protein MALGJ_12270 [Mycolicibacter algericus]
MLGLHGGAVVAAETLIDLLWGDEPPRTAAKALQTHISALRRALGDGFVLTEGTGWILSTTEVDAPRYKLATQLGRDAAAAGDTTQAVVCFDEALALWRGSPELPDSRRGIAEKTRWIEGQAAPGRRPRRRPPRHRTGRGNRRGTRGCGRRRTVARAAMGPADARPLPRRPTG